MQTSLADFIRDTPEGREAEAILRKCVHCGFCTATCPTYQLFADELDGPRGRIYLIKQVVEGRPATDKIRLHLDRCLTCRSCETTCPSGVHYSRLLDIGREVVSRQLPRTSTAAAVRGTLRYVLPRPALIGPAMQLGRWFRPLLPSRLKAKVPALRPVVAHSPLGRHERRMLVLAGCAQSVMAPEINAAAARILDRLDIQLYPARGAGCCGAVRFHLDDPEGARRQARRNIDAWWPHIEAGVEAIVITASGCGVHVRDYGYLLRHDSEYRDRGERVSRLARDIAEVVAGEADALIAHLRRLEPIGLPVAFHSPCTLQHGLKLQGVVERLLSAAGYRLTLVADAHLCCGSAGTYSLLQPEIATRLRANKLAALGAGAPTVVASANIGCIAHLQEASSLPVRHWVELIDERLEMALV